MASRRHKQAIFDAQYAALHGDESQALDYPLYRFVLPYATSRIEMAARMLGDARWGDVIDLGVGAGKLAALKLGSFGRYLGLDISEYQLSLVPGEVRSASNVTLRTADLEEPLDCGDASFDLAISLSTIEYLRDPIAFLSEVHRVLRPGGVFLLHTMNLAFLPRRIQLLFGKLPTFNAAAGWEGGTLHHFTFGPLKALLTETGFAIEQRRCSGLLPSTRRLWPNALASDIMVLCRKAGR